MAERMAAQLAAAGPIARDPAGAATLVRAFEAACEAREFSRTFPNGDFCRVLFEARLDDQPFFPRQRS